MNGVNKMRYVTVSIVVLMTIVLTSCVDYVQSISLKDGKYTMYIRFTLSKALFAVADEDADAWADKLVTGDDLIDGFNKVSTDTEVGAECRLAIDAKTKNADEKAVLPVVSKNKVLIPFLPSEAADDFKSDDAETNDMIVAVLSMAKCRILVGKNIIDKIDSAYFAGKTGQNYSITVFDYGDTWGIEVPFTVFMESDRYKFDNIVLIKG